MQTDTDWNAAKREAGSCIGSAYPSILTELDKEKLEGGIVPLQKHIANLEKGKAVVRSSRPGHYDLQQKRLNYLNHRLVRQFVLSSCIDSFRAPPLIVYDVWWHTVCFLRLCNRTNTCRLR